MLEFLKEFATRDENFENNSEMWEQIFKKVSDESTTTTTEDGEDYKTKYEELKRKYIARFESPSETEPATDDTTKEPSSEDNDDNVTIEDILNEKEK